ncbi:pyridoxamine 5'-phosphate oxidase family protein [Gordonia sp. ABSL1-1]|uniref:pyridoxamine 5'-phosphate oxidase family protein n=1 Tax=Gordonia sp. ABSL1-1 TaxID=3053923 RepID=UPI002572B902|nr:pyridoxamine 5'-phosphate oxidase family protein [Gordonia sp. ABSL1-1]MDL9937140.1 pyridoxamine 5'-phosphate oxidase family protein [Gordonia sp. ABSL1-1]
MVDNPVKVLSSEESWQRLAGAELGRIATSFGGRPDIFPVNFHADPSRILFRSAEGTKLYEIAANEHVAFEADGHDAEGGWSVIAKGTAHVLTSHREIEAADELPLRPWIPTHKFIYVQIDVSEISGREFIFGDEPARYGIDWAR